MGDRDSKKWEKGIQALINLQRSVLRDVQMEEVSTGQVVPFVQFVRRYLQTRSYQAPDQEGAARQTAVYLLFSIIPTHLSAILQLIKRALAYEAFVLLRSLHEALDLVDYLASDRCSRQELVTWLDGNIVEHFATRRAAISVFLDFRFLRDKLTGDQRQILKKMMGVQTYAEALRRLQYRFLSRYVHPTSRRILDCIAPDQAPTDPLEDAIDQLNNETARASIFFTYYCRDFLSPEVFNHLDQSVWRVLTQLREIGPTLARYLAQYYRQQNGPPAA